MTAIDGDVKLTMYRQMLRAAAAERCILQLVDSGEATILYHSGRGQEAVAAGAMAVIGDDDYLLYGHRGVGQLLAKGVSPVAVFGDILANTAEAPWTRRGDRACRRPRSRCAWPERNGRWHVPDRRRRRSVREVPGHRPGRAVHVR